MQATLAMPIDAISMLILLDGQSLGPVIQLRARAVAAQGMVALVDVLQIVQAVGIDVALRQIPLALAVEPVVQDGRHSCRSRPR